MPVQPATLADLHSVLDPAVPTFLLVDPMLGDPFHTGDLPNQPLTLRSARSIEWQRSVTTIPLHPDVPLPARQHPYLVELEGPDDPWLVQAFDAAHDERKASQAGGWDGSGAAPHRIGGWLQSSAYTDQLAITLAALHRIPASVLTREKYFRISDRRVFGLLRHAVSDSRVAGTFGPLESWTCLDVRGQLSTLARPSGDRTDVPDRLAMSREEWGVMSGAEAVNRTLAVTLGTAASADFDVAHIDTIDLYAEGFKAVALARSAREHWPHRFTEPGDETLWSALCLLWPRLRAVPSGIVPLDEWMARTEAAEPVRFAYPEILATLQKSLPRPSTSLLNV